MSVYYDIIIFKIYFQIEEDDVEKANPPSYDTIEDLVI